MSRRLAAGWLLTTLALSSCANTAVETTEPGVLPPHERSDLADIFDPLVAPLGYHVTRASLIDRTTYEVDPAGGHLALYLAPDADISPDQYAADFAGLVNIFLPLVFDRWPELHSFDVCQEPFGSTQETPPSLTIIDLTRTASSEVEWADLDLAGIIALNDRQGISVWARMEVRDSDTWRLAAGL